MIGIQPSVFLRSHPIWFDVCMCHCIYLYIIYIYIYYTYILHRTTIPPFVVALVRAIDCPSVILSIHRSHQNETRDEHTNRCPPLIYFVVEHPRMYLSQRTDETWKHNTSDFHAFIFPSIRPSVSHCTREYPVLRLSRHTANNSSSRRRRHRCSDIPSALTHTHKKESPQQHQSCIWNYLE